MTSDGTTDGAIAQSGITYDSTTKSFTLIGSEYQHSVSGDSVTTGTTVITQVPCVSGSTGHFNYFVKESNGAIRGGTIIAAWDCSGAVFTDYSTTDLNNTTEGISFTVDVNSNNLRILSNVTSGTWTIKVGIKIVF